MRGIWLTVLAFTFLMGCTSAPGGGTAASPTPESVTQTPNQTAAVIVRNLEFVPATVTIPAGGTVLWKFEGPSPHSATSDSESAQAWDSTILGPGATYSVTFDQPGTYPYHCTPHRSMGMTGVVIVQ